MNYDLSDELAEELLEYIQQNQITISDDLDSLDVDDDMLLAGVPAMDDDLDLDIDDADDTPDLDFDGDFDMMTGIHYICIKNMMMIKKAKALNLEVMLKLMIL